MVTQSGRGDPHMATFHKRYSRSVVHRPLLENAPSPFAEAVIGLAAELIAVTNTVSVSDRTQAKLRYLKRYCGQERIQKNKFKWEETKIKGCGKLANLGVYK